MDQKEDPDKNIYFDNYTEEIFIIFDWDDTLLASTYLRNKGYDFKNINQIIIQENDKKELEGLEQLVIKCLQIAIQYGQVCIITNSESGFVEKSAKKFMPLLAELLQNIQVISARSLYQEAFPDLQIHWKFNAMKDKLNSLLAKQNTSRHIISFGDSVVEREAIFCVTKGYPDTWTKSIKLKDIPTLEQLTRQIQLIVSSFDFIRTFQGNLDLLLT